MANRTKLTSEKQKKFLELIAETGNVSKAAKGVGISRFSLYRRRNEDMDFLARWNAAVEMGLDRLEDEAMRRASEGWNEPVWHQGKKCGVVRKYSDTLLMFLLNGGRPQKFRNRVSAEITPTAPLVVATLAINTKDPNEAARAYAQFVSAGK